MPRVAWNAAASNCFPQRRRRGKRLALALLVNLFHASIGLGQYVLEDAHDSHRYDPNHLLLPFAFYSPRYHFGGGIVLYGSGLIQPQSGTFAYALGSANGTYGLSFGEDDLQLRPIDRLFVDAQVGYLQDQSYTAYINGNPAFRGQAAGTNDSSEKNFFTNRGIDVYGHLIFKYLLPIGGGREMPIARYVVENGILKRGATGGQGWDPISTGRTYLLLTPFLEDLSLETPIADFHRDENGLRFGLVYDNTDFPLNPSCGNISRVTISRDFGLFSSSDTWTNLSSEYAQFLDLGRSPLFRQQVVAFDLWTSYSLTWDNAIQGGARQLAGAPPFYDGAALGGNTRLRGFAENRFWDRAALYGAIELRLVPDWNPLGRIKLLKEADITWMQWVIFAEAGRVADAYTPQLFEHLKGDVGFGLRILANDTLVRFDVAASNEGFAVWAQFSQPF